MSAALQELLVPVNERVVQPDEYRIDQHRVELAFEKLGIPYDSEAALHQNFDTVGDAVRLVSAVAAEDDYARMSIRAREMSDLFETYLMGSSVSVCARVINVEKNIFYHSMSSFLKNCRQVLDSSGYWAAELKESGDLLDKIGIAYYEREPIVHNVRVARVTGRVAIAYTAWDRVDDTSLGDSMWLGSDKSDKWQDKALCAQTDPGAFHAEAGGSTREAKRVCLSCEVKDDCLEAALENDEAFGVWGGLSELERRKLKKHAV